MLHIKVSLTSLRGPVLENADNPNLFALLDIGRSETEIVKKVSVFESFLNSINVMYYKIVEFP